MRKSICFAYFADGQFIGWYVDSLGTIRKTGPKIYGYTPEQVETIRTNFNYKIKKLKEASNLATVTNNPGLALLDNSLNNDKENLSQYQEIELRIVECPFYDGPNPDFNIEKDKEWWDNRDNRPEEDRYKSDPTNKNWIYADYKEVNKWAIIPPTEFLEVIKYN